MPCQTGSRSHISRKGSWGLGIRWIGYTVTCFNASISFYNIILITVVLFAQYQNFPLNRLAYPKYIINELMKRYQDKNINLNFIYEISCVLSSHMHVRNFLVKTNNDISPLIIHFIVLIRKWEKTLWRAFSWLYQHYHIFWHKLQCQGLFLFFSFVQKLLAKLLTAGFIKIFTPYFV